MTTVEHLLESLLRNGCEVHISFVPKHKTRKEYDKDHFMITDWNKPTRQYHSDSLAGALALMHEAHFGPPDFRGALKTPCFMCKKQLGCLWRDDDYNGACVDCYKRDKLERYSNRT